MAWVQAIIGAAEGNQERVAADNAANAQTQAGHDSIKAGLSVYNQNRQDNYGGMVLGNSAQQMLAKLYGLDYYDGMPSYDGISVTGGDTTVKKPSFLQSMHDPGGFLWKQESSTTPMQFSTGNALTGSPNNTGTIPGNGNANGNVVKGTGVADYSSFKMGPDYQVRLEGGLQGNDRSAAARGGLYSGRHAADITDYAGDMATAAFGDYRNALMGLAGYGQQATSSVGAAGSQFGNQAGNALTNMGNARASGYINQSNSWSNQANNLSGIFGDWYGQRQGSTVPTNNGGGGYSGGPTTGPYW